MKSIISVFTLCFALCIVCGEQEARAHQTAVRDTLDSLHHTKALLLLDSAELVKSVFVDEHRALDMVNRAIGLDSTIVKAYGMKSELLRMNGQLETALQMYEALEAKQRHQSESRILWEHANLLYLSGQKEKAEQKWRKAVAVNEAQFAAEPDVPLLADIVKLLCLSDGKKAAAAYLKKRLPELVALKVEGRRDEYVRMSESLALSVEELVEKQSPISSQHYSPSKKLAPRPPKGLRPMGKDAEIDFVCDFYLTEVLGWFLKKELPQKCTPELAYKLSYINFSGERCYTGMEFRTRLRDCREKDDYRVLSIKRLAKHRFEVKYMDGGIKGCTIVKTVVTPQGIKMAEIVKRDESWKKGIIMID